MIVSNLQEFYSNLIEGAPIIAIDYGMKKTGVAISNQSVSFAMPFKQLNLIDDAQKINVIIDLISIRKACAIVIGLPIDMNGIQTNQTKIVLNFAKKMAAQTDLPIYMQDERLTSRAADSLLKSFGMKRRARNANDDAVAASIILQDTISLLSKINNENI